MSLKGVHLFSFVFGPLKIWTGPTLEMVITSLVELIENLALSLNLATSFFDSVTIKELSQQLVMVTFISCALDAHS